MRSTVPGFAEGVVSFDSKTVVCTIASRLTIKSDLVVAGLKKIKSNLIQNRSRTNEVALATFRLSKKDDAQRERSMRCAVSGFAKRVVVMCRITARAPRRIQALSSLYQPWRLSSSYSLNVGLLGGHCGAGTDRGDSIR